MAKGLLLAAFDFSTAHEDEFHDWYDLEHLPERQRVPGFLACERWIGAANPKYAVASYDLETVEVMKSAPYRAIAYENLSGKQLDLVGSLTGRGWGKPIVPENLAHGEDRDQMYQIGRAHV